MPIEVPNRDEWFPDSFGFPHPDWLAINEWIQNVTGSDDRHEATEQITRYWLARLAADLGSPHRVVESNHYFLLSTRDQKRSRPLLEFLEKAHDHVLQTLGKAAGIRRLRKLAVLRLSKPDDVFEILAGTEANADAATAFFGSGSLPVVYCENKRVASDFRRLAHAVTYHLLAHLRLSPWLYVGLGEALKVDLSGGRFAVLDEDLLAVHHQSWNSTSIQDFWSGKSFWDEEWRSLSNNLAEVLFDIVRRELRPDFAKLQRFIQEAAFGDAGQGAAFRFFGIGLGEIAAVFLGEGDWSPKPSTWKRRGDRA